MGSQNGFEHHRHLRPSPVSRLDGQHGALGALALGALRTLGWLPGLRQQRLREARRKLGRRRGESAGRERAAGEEERAKEEEEEEEEEEDQGRGS